MFSFSKGIALVFAILAGAALLNAQFDSGQISGFVRDPSGAVIPAAAVVATNSGTRQTFHAATSAEGYYVFPRLVVGTYTLTIEAAGFKRYVKSGITLDAEAKVAADADLTDLVDDHGDSQPTLVRQDIVSRSSCRFRETPVTTLTGKRVLSPDTVGCGCVNTTVMFAFPAPDGKPRRPLRYNSCRLPTG